MQKIRNKNPREPRESHSRNLLTQSLISKFPALPSGSENRFTVKTHDNQSIFLASEGSTPRDRMIWGSSRSFMMHLMDKQYQEALTMRRVFGCRFFCLPMKLQSLEVWLNPGILLGIIQEKFSISDRLIVIESERGEEMFKVRIGLGHSICMPKEYHFRVSFVITFMDFLLEFRKISPKILLIPSDNDNG